MDNPSGRSQALGQRCACPQFDSHRYNRKILEWLLREKHRKAVCPL